MVSKALPAQVLLGFGAIRVPRYRLVFHRGQRHEVTRSVAAFLGL